MRELRETRGCWFFPIWCPASKKTGSKETAFCLPRTISTPARLAARLVEAQEALAIITPSFRDGVKVSAEVSVLTRVLVRALSTATTVARFGGRNHAGSRPSTVSIAT